MSDFGLRENLIRATELINSRREREAIPYLDAAAQLGHAKAAYHYALIVLKYEDHNTRDTLAFPKLLISAKADIMDAIVRVIEAYLYGRGTPPELGAAVEWLARADRLAKEGTDAFPTRKRAELLGDIDSKIAQMQRKKIAQGDAATLLRYSRKLSDEDRYREAYSALEAFSADYPHRVVGELRDHFIDVLLELSEQSKNPAHALLFLTRALNLGSAEAAKRYLRLHLTNIDPLVTSRDWLDSVVSCDAVAPAEQELVALLDEAEKRRMALDRSVTGDPHAGYDVYILAKQYGLGTPHEQDARLRAAARAQIMDATLELAPLVEPDDPAYVEIVRNAIEYGSVPTALRVVEKALRTGRRQSPSLVESVRLLSDRRADLARDGLIVLAHSVHWGLGGDPPDHDQTQVLLQRAGLEDDADLLLISPFCPECEARLRAIALEVFERKEFHRFRFNRRVNVGKLDTFEKFYPVLLDVLRYPEFVCADCGETTRKDSVYFLPEFTTWSSVVCNDCFLRRKDADSYAF